MTVLYKYFDTIAAIVTVYSRLRQCDSVESNNVYTEILLFGNLCTRVDCAVV
jgi:hypothetical protein